MSPHRPLSGRLVAATHNAGKLIELQVLLAPWRLDLVSAGELGLPEPEETGDTFVANAILKARAATEASGLPALADDSGLCVAALNGEPGLHTARWAETAGGRDFDYAMAKVEAAIQARNAPAPWAAHFISVLALTWPDGRVETFEGRIDGDLVFPPRGPSGFGYDPCFRPEGHSRTFGEMSAQEKHGLPPDDRPALSHRARAIQKLARACLK